MIGKEISRVAIDCRSWTFRQHRVVPGGPVVLKAVEHVLVPFFKIRPLARILDDIEQELIAGDLQILPVAVARGALFPGLEAPEQLARMGRRAPCENWQEILAVRRI